MADVTDFPTKGDNQKISLRNSQYPQFDFAFAKRIKEDYPDIWDKGGNIRGNEAFNLWAKARDGQETQGVLDWIKEREAWSARHFENSRIAGVIAQVKWGMIGSRGEKYMKDLIRDEIKKQDEDKKMSVNGKGEVKHITVDFEVKNVSEVDDYFTFEGYASTFGNVDLGGDRVMNGAFMKSIAKCMDGKRVPVLWQHDQSMPLGVYTMLREDEKGLYVKGQMPKSDAFVRDRAMPQMKAGSIGAMSIGYIVRDYDYDGDVRQLKQVDLFEISLVTMPMNEQAVITGMKRVVPHANLLPMASRERAWDSSAAIERVREFTDSEDEPSARYKSAFLYYDPDMSDEFVGYKLPIADVIDGELKAVPRAIFAAAAALSGARGGVDIPDEDKDGVAKVLNRYYEAMDMESPLKKQYVYTLSKEEVGDFTVKDIEQLLKNGVKCSRNLAKAIAVSSGNLCDAEKTGQCDAEFVKSLQEITGKLQEDLNDGK